MNSLDFNHQARVLRHAKSKLPASLFITQSLAPAERFAAWRESMSVFLDAALENGGDPTAFHGENESYLIDDIMLTRGMAKRQKFDRPSAKIAASSIDHYMFQVFLSGHTEIKVGRRTVRSQGGRVLGFDLGEVMDSFNTDFDVLCVVVARSRLAPLLMHPDSIQGSMPDEHGVGDLLSGYMRNLYSAAPHISPADAKGVAQALLELIAATFNSVSARPGDLNEVTRRALLLRAQTFVRDHLAEVLSPETVAAAIGVSRTALYRLFEPIGGIAAYIRELRLRRSLSDIMSVRCAHMQISEIAYRNGFSDAAHFARTFRRRFGQSASEVRETARAYVRRDRVALDPRIGDRLYEEWIAGLA